MLNRMCNDCGCLHKDCDGTENQNWTGCVYKIKVPTSAKEEIMNIGLTEDEAEDLIEEEGYED